MSLKNVKGRGLSAPRPSQGEEKPDEELMGKRKSSPRLSPASFSDAGILHFLRTGENYTCLPKKFVAIRAMGYD